MKKTLFEDVLILSAIRLARFCVKWLPLTVCLALARGAGWIAYRMSKRRSIAYKNLRMVFAGEKSAKELKRLAVASFQNLAMSGVEMLRIPDMTREDLERHFRIEGRENFEPYVRQGKGIIFLTGHFGSWELLNIVGALSGYSMVALARVQKHPRSDAYLNSLRVSKGSQVIYKGMPVREILRALRQGRIVGILSDQDGGRNGRFVNFFNRLSSTPPGVAAFSLHTGAPIFPTFIVREKGAFHRVVVEKPILVSQNSLSPEEAQTRILQEFADALERQVRRSPEQWLWAHRRWKSSPDRLVVILSDGKAGHFQQSMAFFDAMRRQRESQGFPPERLVLRVIELRYQSSFRKKCWKAIGTLFRGCPPFAETGFRWALTPESSEALRHAYADIVISCGSSLVELNLWMKKENSAKSVVVMDPKISSGAFDAVVAPRHDRLNDAGNVFLTDGALSSLRPEDLRREAEKLVQELGLPRSQKFVGLLIGGDSAELKFDPVFFEKILRSVLNFARENDLKILATTSRRTPVWAESVLKQFFEKSVQCSLLVIANEANRVGAVAGILALSDVVMVSGESMSMVSEAVASGKNVLVFYPCRNSRFKRKYTDLLGRWEAERKISVCDTENVNEMLKRSITSASRTQENKEDETERTLSEAVRRIF